MGRRWIVDASNVLGSRPDGWWRDRPRALHRLLDEIARWRAETGEPVLVVADGHPTAWVPEGTQRGVHVHHARSSRRDAADDEIVRIVERHADPSSLVVATSDRGLADRVAALGAGVEGARRFRQRIESIGARDADRRVLDVFGTDESALLGRGGEARVFAIDDATVVRLPHPGADPAMLRHRRALLDAISSGAAPLPFAVPEVLEERYVDGRPVIVERRLPGRDALVALSDPDTDRGTLIRSHLDAANLIRTLPCPTAAFGELWGDGAIAAPSFEEWSVRRLRTSLAAGGGPFAHLEPVELTRQLLDALDVDDSSPPVLTHLDAFLGNMLTDGTAITAVLDFGPMTIGGIAGLDPAVAVAYLAPEITPTANDDDRATAGAWASGAGLAAALAPTERWIAAYWTGAVDDGRLQRWCRRVLCDDGVAG